MSGFDDLVAAVDAVVTTHLGGTVTITPMVKGKFGAPDGADPVLVPVDVEGVYSTDGKDRQPAQDFNTRVAGTEDVVWISHTEAVKVPYEIKPGYFATVLVRGVARKMRITVVTRCDQGSYELTLSEETE